VSLAEIAERQDISLSYLEQLFARLRRAGLVKSVRGPGGGYLPGAELEDITIAAIVEAVDSEAPTGRCTPGATQCCAGIGEVCQTHDLWEQLGNQIRWFLNRVSVADVLTGRVPGAVGANDTAPFIQAAADDD
jgi:Rrf2 family iron-sulfur cluster assembly transcriptional regulator